MSALMPGPQPPKVESTDRRYTVYFASELFSHKHLIGNAYLAEAIHEASQGKFICRLPQDFESDGHHPHLIRDTDIHALLECDIGLFNFDGTELDSGTVVEFMLAKFADLPAVILRSDFRAAGDQDKGDPWNLMCSFYPRTESVVSHSLACYKTAAASRGRAKVNAHDHRRLAGQSGSATAQLVCEQIAAEVVQALNRVIAQPPVLTKPIRQAVYTWLSQMPGFRGNSKALHQTYEKLLATKIERGLL